MPSPIINDRFTALALMKGLQPQRIHGNRAAVGAIWAMTASPTSIIAGRQVHMMGSLVEAMTIVGEDKEWGSHRRMVTRQKGNNQHRHRRQPFNLQPRGSAVGTMFDKLFNSVSTPPTPQFSGETTHFFPSDVYSLSVSLSTYCPLTIYYLLNPWFSSYPS